MAFTEDFIHAWTALPLRPTIAQIDAVLGPALHHEELMRRRLVNADNSPHYGLIDLFGTSPEVRYARPRVVGSIADYVSTTLFPIHPLAAALFPTLPLASPRSPSCVVNLAEFQAQFDSFSNGVLRGFSSWDNVIIAGGAVLAALIEQVKGVELSKVFSSAPYSSADIDIFLWGLTHDEAQAKIDNIFEAVKASVPWEVIAVRRANVITIHTQFPCRHVQIVLRMYQSPMEILIGFDIDCSSVCYDGEKVWITPRAIAAITTRILRIDMLRRSPSYELRLVKYMRRGWEIFYPHLRRQDIHPSIYDRDLQILPHGLARLLVIEKILQDTAYYSGLWYPLKPFPPTQIQGEDLIEADDEERDYVAFQVPYALHWDARKIENLGMRVKSLDLSYNQRNYLHRHTMVVSNDIQTCFEDICGTCPLPRTRDEIDQVIGDNKKYIRGPLRFITENPGNQLISGSFNPINDDEWDREAYEGI